jgi:Fibronectin type III domain
MAGTTYQVTVLAYNDVGNSPRSDSVLIIAGRVPTAPINVRLLSQNATSITIVWTTPDNGGSPITTYKIFSDSNSNGVTFTEIISSTGLVNNFTLTVGIVTNLAY